jgi:hypothetical protein
LQVVTSKYDDWLQSYDKNAKTPDRCEVFIINFKLVQNKKKREKNEENCTEMSLHFQFTKIMHVYGQDTFLTKFGNLIYNPFYSEKSSANLILRDILS